LIATATIRVQRQAGIRATAISTARLLTSRFATRKKFTLPVFANGLARSRTTFLKIVARQQWTDTPAFLLAKDTFRTRVGGTSGRRIERKTILPDCDNHLDKFRSIVDN
jgi:hypothetical protein